MSAEIPDPHFPARAYAKLSQLLLRAGEFRGPSPDARPDGHYFTYGDGEISDSLTPVPRILGVRPSDTPDREGALDTALTMELQRGGAIISVTLRQRLGAMVLRPDLQDEYTMLMTLYRAQGGDPHENDYVIAGPEGPIAHPERHPIGVYIEDLPFPES